jgi:hypothetical protein
MVAVSEGSLGKGDNSHGGGVRGVVGFDLGSVGGDGGEGVHDVGTHVGVDILREEGVGSGAVLGPTPIVTHHALRVYNGCKHALREVWSSLEIKASFLSIRKRMDRQIESRLCKWMQICVLRSKYVRIKSVFTIL